MTTQRTYSPIDGSLVAERELGNVDSLILCARAARVAQREYAGTPIAKRTEMARRFATIMRDNQDVWGRELTLQMGRPISYSPFELVGTHERAMALAALAPQAFAPVEPSAKAGFRRWIQREPLGVVLSLAPWNYPYLTAVNSVIAALLAGNAVVLKHSEQTPLCGERFAEALEQSGAPKDLFQCVHASHEVIASFLRSGEVDHVAFTGSVAGGNAVVDAASARRVSVALELGGKDAAYVREDADIENAVEGLVDGAFFNSGQSCCGIERIYVAESRFESFLERYIATTQAYKLGDPLEQATTLGPMVRASSADFVREQVREAVAGGAQTLIDPALFAADEAGTAYLAPQVLINVNPSMRLMQQESFGPVVGICSVGSDEEAVLKINDSRYGLTASLWTSDDKQAGALAQQLAVGTVFLNRCDYLDPELAWTGVKDSGHGCTLSKFGLEAFTRPKSFHFKLSRA